MSQHPLLDLDSSYRRAHPVRCVTLYGAYGCYTTGWQEAVEIGPKVRRWVQKDRRFEAAVTKLYKRHARGMPHFLGLNRSYDSSYDGDEVPDTLIISTECHDGSPSWEPRRAAKRKNFCALDTIIALASEI